MRGASTKHSQRTALVFWCGGGNFSAGEVEEFGVGANFVVRTRALIANFAAGQQLADKTFADDNGFERFTQRYFAKIELHALLAPREREIAAYGSERDFALKLLKTFFVELDAIQIVADEKLLTLFCRSIVHQRLQQVDVERGGIRLKKTLGHLRAARETVGQIQRARNHDARVGVHPKRGRGILKRNADPQLEWRKIAGLRARIVSLSDGQDFARQHAGAGHGALGGASGLVLVNRQDNGVAFNEDLSCTETFQHALHRLVQGHAEMGGWIHAAFQQVLGDTGGTADVSFDDHVIDDWIVRRSSLVRMQELVEALIGAGKFAGTLGMDQIDALHPSGDLLIIAAIAAQTHQVFGELEADRQRLLRATSANGPGGLLEFLHGYLARRKFFQNLRDALGFVPKDKRLLQLLKVNGRAIFGRDFAQFVAREDMEEQVAFLEPVNPLLKKMGADFRGGSRIFIRTCAGVEQAPGVCGLVQIIA